MNVCIIKRILCVRSCGTAATGDHIHFTELQDVHKSAVDLYSQYFKPCTFVWILALLNFYSTVLKRIELEILEPLHWLVL